MNHSTPLFDIDGRPTEPLRELLTLFKIEHNGTLANIRDATQAAWYHAGKLRAEIGEEHGDKLSEAMPLFRLLGFVDEVRSPSTQYFYCVLLGDTVVAVRKRLAILISEWERGVRFMNFVFVGSHRPLMPGKESMSVLTQADNAELPIREGWQWKEPMPDTEIEMMRMVYDQAKLPESWRKVLHGKRVSCVSPALVSTANTRDTLEAWGTQKSSKILLVSSQPFVSYQCAVASKVMRKSRAVDCIGYGSASLPVTTYLDNAAKLIYELAGA